MTNQSHRIIPAPNEIVEKSGSFILTPETIIQVDALHRENGSYLRELLAPPTGFKLPVQHDNPKGVQAIRLVSGGHEQDLGSEGYLLDISPDEVRITAPTAAGGFYGIQTLRQLLPREIESRALVADISWQVTGVTIKDRPRFRWRGFMLDEGRHFHGKETVLQVLEWMALHKLNTFHWHLTEDQGWRLEIKQYPKLTEIGSSRPGTARSFIGRYDGLPHAGFYTQEDVQEIVGFAAHRQITIVPEIEMPGHSQAALAAYPELSCRGVPIQVATNFGIKRDVFCAGKESVYTFLQDVLDEVMALFPGPCVHIGGDEVLKGRWKRCLDCRRRVTEAGLESADALQAYFTQRIVAYLVSHSKRPIGWNEILQEGLHPDAVVQYWLRNRQNVIQAVRAGREVIMSPYFDLYLDHGYNLTPLSRAYRFEPVFPELDDSEAERVLGLEAPLWTEFVPNRARLDYQVFPRLTAVAERGWSTEACRDYQDFRRRLERFLNRLDLLGVGYAPQADVEPSRLKRLFGWFTILQRQTKTAPEKGDRFVQRTS